MDDKTNGGADTSTAWRRISDDLAACLMRGDYETGSALPPAQDLARRYGVHRHTVRQACLHLQDIGLITIRRGAGAYFTGGRLPYRIGKRVRLRENLRDASITSRMIDAEIGACEALFARELGLEPAAPVWRIRLVNHGGALALSTSLHIACATRFPDLPSRLAAADHSVTAAFASYGVFDYTRRSTHITARRAQAHEADWLDIACNDPVLVTRSIDITVDGASLQIVEGVFRADRIEIRVDME